MTSSDLKVNQLIDIEYENEKDNTCEYLASRIEEITEDSLIVASPMRKGQLVPLHIGQNIKVCYTFKENSYAFVSRILDRRSEPIPVLTIKQPDEILKIQRRSFVRLPISLPVYFKEVQEQTVHQGITVDISGGGALFLSNVRFAQGDLLDFELHLPERNSICCNAKVVRLLIPQPGGGSKYKVAVNYVDISEPQRDKIFNFIFEKQREWIKKGLLN